MPAGQPNLVFILADQLRASTLPLYGETQIETPNIERLAREGVTFTQNIASCPICTPHRAMLLTGRYPQTTGHVQNNIRTRHDELSIADAFGHAGYRTGWIGKWHLYSGPEPIFVEGEYIPDGRDRLGFDYFRAYNYHTRYHNGLICLDNGKMEPWIGYETEGLLGYLDDFLNQAGDSPFCVFVSPHQPHPGGKCGDGMSITQDIMPNGRLAPQRFINRVTAQPLLPPNVPLADQEDVWPYYQDYLAMTLAVDEMVGNIVRRLEQRGLSDNTIVVFTSDHGSMMGSHGLRGRFWPWQKRVPYEESIHVPLIVRYPGRELAGSTNDALVSPVDFMPTLCSLCGVPIPKTVEGQDLSHAWKGQAHARVRDDVLTMYISNGWLETGEEWRGIRTKTWNYYRFRTNDRRGLFDIEQDPYMLQNLVYAAEFRPVVEDMEARLQRRMAALDDQLMPASDYASWFVERQVVRNAHGELGDPTRAPDWSLL